MATAKKAKQHQFPTDAIAIMQIWQNTDLRAGENKLRKYLNDERTLFPGQVVIFMNRKRNMIRVLGHTKGMYLEYAGDRCTYDFELRRNSIIEAVGKAFGLNLFLMKTAEITDK